MGSSDQKAAGRSGDTAQSRYKENPTNERGKDHVKKKKIFEKTLGMKDHRKITGHSIGQSQMHEGASSGLLQICLVN